MDRILQIIKKNYKAINITILCICLYLVIFLPFISSLLEKISPVLTRCPYMAITGKPCPLCGGTRFLKNIKNVFSDFHYVINIYGLIILIMIIEIVFRIINIKNREKREKIIKIDIIAHIVLAIGYIIYIIYFFVSNK